MCCYQAFLRRIYLVYSTDRSKAVVPVLVLLFVAYSRRRIVLCLTLCYFVLVFFSPFSIAITSLSAFRRFVPFVLALFCLFPIPLGVWEVLRFVIVALPWTFLYLFFTLSMCNHVQKDKRISTKIDFYRDFSETFNTLLKRQNLFLLSSLSLMCLYPLPRNYIHIYRENSQKPTTGNLRDKGFPFRS